MELQQIDVTGCRIVGAIDKTLGHAGPKHHGVILGLNRLDNKVYIAESMRFGYQLASYDDFYARYSPNGEVIVSPNDGEFENIAVAKRALNEISQGGRGVYNLITNNCECFVNRAMHNSSRSQQIINTGIGLLALAGIVYVVRNSR
ncbi:hypothetical protein [Vibrio mimicus]|uniref:hypothetical protein n=1 Tax=Vibrio mimicus TaxID=674 RepID=UPI002FF048CF